MNTDILYIFRRAQVVYGLHIRKSYATNFFSVIQAEHGLRLFQLLMDCEIELAAFDYVI